MDCPHKLSLDKPLLAGLQILRMIHKHVQVKGTHYFIDVGRVTSVTDNIASRESIEKKDG